MRQDLCGGQVAQSAFDRVDALSQLGEAGGRTGEPGCRSEREAQLLDNVLELSNLCLE